MSDSLRTPLGRVRGLGSAKEGSGHFIAQRVSAVGLLILAPWFAISAALTLRGGYAGALTWFGNPLNAVGTLLLVATAAYHMRLGMQVIIEDYIHKPATKTLLLILNTFLCVSLAVAGVFAILQLSPGV